jgi:hypothetical protein
MHAIFNYCEAVFWAIVSLVILIGAAKTSRRVKKIAYVAVPTLFLFGVSDIVEVFTGAWWKPFWLLLWKGLCIIVLVSCFVYYWRKTLSADATKHPNAEGQ